MCGHRRLGLGWVEIEFACIERGVDVGPESIERALERVAGDYPTEVRLDCLVHGSPLRVSRDRSRDLLPPT
jgi:hypothetical protein